MTKIKINNVPHSLIDVIRKSDPEAFIFAKHRNLFKRILLDLGIDLHWMSLVDLKSFLHDNGITSQDEYNDMKTSGKFPYNIPARPQNIYPNFKGWDDLFKRDRTVNIDWMPYDELKTLCISLGIKSVRQYKEAKLNKMLPVTAPADPGTRHYKRKWKGYHNLFNTEQRFNKKFLSYKELQDLCIEKNITTGNGYSHAKKIGVMPNNAPSIPKKHYAEWIDWDTFFLKTGWIEYIVLQKLCIDNNIKTKKEYNAAKNNKTLPENCPANPQIVYEEWIGWYEFLGLKRRSKCKDDEWLSYSKLKSLCKENNIRTQKDYIKAKIEGIIFSTNAPSEPSSVYPEWISFKHFFDKEITFELCLNNAKSHGSLNEWLKQSKLFYNRAHKNNWLKEIKMIMKW